MILRPWGLYAYDGRTGYGNTGYPVSLICYQHITIHMDNWCVRETVVAP